MAGRPADLEQEWSVHAQLTFSHGSTQVEAAEPQVRAPVAHPCYGFQRGNIVFTTKPPGESTVRRTPQPYGRRCMSTYNIKLDPPCLAPPRCHHTVTLSCAPNEESCDVCMGGRHSPARRAHTFTSHFCTRVPDKTVNTKTVASQTSQIFTPPPLPASPSSQLQVPDLSDKEGSKSPKRLSRSPARLKGKSPLLNKVPSDAGKKKQPRTVHIDVYCTGSEASCSSEAEDPSDSSHQTVFESENVKVVHTREDDRLPQALCRQRRQTLSEASSSHSFIEGATELPGDSTISSLYPSQRSSFASGVSVQDSFQTDSSLLSQVTSSCAIFSDELVTSWKDTSDFESIRQSDLSLDRTESFEYENMNDRLRILQKEKAWRNSSRSWRSPDKERKYNMQQRRYQQYIDRRGSPFPQWQIEENLDDSEDIDDSSSELSDNSAVSEMAWSFGNLNDKLKTVKREDTVRRARDMDVRTEEKLKKQASKMLESGSLSDSAAPSPVQKKFVTRNTVGPFGVKEGFYPKTKLESTITTPFTAVPGKKTDQMSKAEKFGTILGTLRKPGHHVGPSKNPDCSCYNCRMYYEEMGYRNRTRSLGDVPSSKQRDKWKATLDTLMQNKLNEDSGSGEWDMGTPV